MNRHYTSRTPVRRPAPTAPTTNGDDLSTAQVCAQAGIVYRQLDHWLRTGIVDLPSQRDVGSGTPRRFTPADTALIVAVAAEKRDLDDRFVAWSTGRYWRQLTTKRKAS